MATVKIKQGPGLLQGPHQRKDSLLSPEGRKIIIITVTASIVLRALHHVIWFRSQQQTVKSVFRPQQQTVKSAL